MEFFSEVRQYIGQRVGAESTSQGTPELKSSNALERLMPPRGSIVPSSPTARLDAARPRGYDFKTHSCRNHGGHNGHRHRDPTRPSKRIVLAQK